MQGLPPHDTASPAAQFGIEKPAYLSTPKLPETEREPRTLPQTSPNPHPASRSLQKGPQACTPSVPPIHVIARRENPRTIAPTIPPQSQNPKRTPPQSPHQPILFRVPNTSPGGCLHPTSDLPMQIKRGRVPSTRTDGNTPLAKAAPAMQIREA